MAEDLIRAGKSWRPIPLAGIRSCLSFLRADVVPGPSGPGAVRANLIAPMRDELSLSRHRLAALATGLVVLAILGLGLAIWRIVQSETRMTQEVGRTQRVIDHLRSLHEQFRVADTDLRAYLLSGDESFAASYESAAQESLQWIGALDAESDGKFIGREQLDKLKAFLASRIEQGNQAIRLRREQGPGAAVTISNTERSEKATAAAMAVLNHLLREQQQQLTMRQIQGDRYLRLLRVLAYGVVVILVAAGAIIFWMRSWIVRLQTGLVTMCAWTKRVRHDGVWVDFDIYLEKRFGVRVTHGMSEEVAAQMRLEMAQQGDDILE